MSDKPKALAVDQQMEFEAASLLMIALKPLSRSARQRVVAFVGSQLEDIEPSPYRAVPRGSFMDLIYGRSPEE